MGRLRRQRLGSLVPVSGTIVMFATMIAAIPPAWSDGYWFYPLGDRIEVERLSDEPIPFKTEPEIPGRPALMSELGDPFLDTGPLFPGFEVPGLGWVLQPRLWSYLIGRTAVQTFDGGPTERNSEFAARLDAYANLQLTGTEKLILGLRPLDENQFSRFTRYSFANTDTPQAGAFTGEPEGGTSELNVDVETLFLEGDLGSVFANLDREGQRMLDFGFTVGRQLIIFQEGILINDTVDALGFIRNNVNFPGTSNLRLSGMWAWHRLDRVNGRTGALDTRRGSDPQMYALFTAADMPVSTVNLDLVYVDDDLSTGDAVYVGVAAIQRLGHFGTAFRANNSIALDDEVPAVSNGTLLSAEISWHPPASNDIVYVNPFWGIDDYTQVGREPVGGNALGSLGILFASALLSNYGAEVAPFASEVAGAAVGYQAFWDNNRRNLVLEIAGRKDTDGGGTDALGFGFQLQQAIGQHFQLQLEGFYRLQERNEDANGARLELLVVY